MKISEIREMSTEELNHTVYSLKEQLFNLRRKKAVGQIENPAEIKKVRKDIALISRISGVPNKGRDIDSLISDIETILGYNMMSNAFLVGAGSLGTALCCYKGFDNYGLSIVGAFDKFPKNIGKKVGNVPLFDIKDLTADAVKDLEVEIGIICVPDKAAQEIADQLVEAGIKAIWNLAPTKISVPRSVIVLNSDLANALAFLSHELYLKKQKEN